MENSKSRIVVTGGGIVGLASAYSILEREPEAAVTVIEKEKSLGQHQTGHNSGVIHSGIYYRPGSLKAQNCREGKLTLEAFCEAEGIPFERCGKVIVAIAEEELPILDGIFERGQANGVDCRLISKEELSEIEPHAAGIKAIHVPESGIVDYLEVCTRLSEKIRSAGGEIVLGSTVTGFHSAPDSLTVEYSAGGFPADRVVNCGGLQSDRLAKLSGRDPEAKIVPFRGEYFTLKPEAESLVNHLIYPVPDPAFPFLGVHFTRMIQGGIECGPNAVLAFAREGYRKSDINPKDLLESLTYPGFLKLASKYWKIGAGEMWRSFSKAAFVKALSRLLPDIREEHLSAAPAGVRAQAVSREGSMIDDFLILSDDRVVNVCNAPSPAATSSLAIGKKIADSVFS